jgi:hypothetical protein
MHKYLKAILPLTCIAVSAGVCGPALAQSASGHTEKPAPTFTEVIPEAVSKPEILKGTFIHSGKFGDFVAADTFTPIDGKLTVRCAAGPCTISATIMVQQGGEEFTKNFSELCLVVDGTKGDACLFQNAATPTNGTFANVVQGDIFTGLATGNHTVQTVFLSNQGAAVGYFYITYQVYEP